MMLSTPRSSPYKRPPPAPTPPPATRSNARVHKAIKNDATSIRRAVTNYYMRNVANRMPEILLPCTFAAGGRDGAASQGYEDTDPLGDSSTPWTLRPVDEAMPVWSGPGRAASVASKKLHQHLLAAGTVLVRASSAREDPHGSVGKMAYVVMSVVVGDAATRVAGARYECTRLYAEFTKLRQEDLAPTAHAASLVEELRCAAARVASLQEELRELASTHVAFDRWLAQTTPPGAAAPDPLLVTRRRIGAIHTKAKEVACFLGSGTFTWEEYVCSERFRSDLTYIATHPPLEVVGEAQRFALPAVVSDGCPAVVPALFHPLARVRAALYNATCADKVQSVDGIRLMDALTDRALRAAAAESWPATEGRDGRLAALGLRDVECDLGVFL